MNINLNFPIEIRSNSLGNDSYKSNDMKSDMFGGLFESVGNIKEDSKDIDYDLILSVLNNLKILNQDDNSTNIQSDNMQQENISDMELNDINTIYEYLSDKKVDLENLNIILQSTISSKENHEAKDRITLDNIIETLNLSDTRSNSMANNIYKLDDMKSDMFGKVFESIGNNKGDSKDSNYDLILSALRMLNNGNVKKTIQIDDMKQENISNLELSNLNSIYEYLSHKNINVDSLAPILKGDILSKENQVYEENLNLERIIEKLSLSEDEIEFINNKLNIVDNKDFQFINLNNKFKVIDEIDIEKSLNILKNIYDKYTNRYTSINDNVYYKNEMDLKTVQNGEKVINNIKENLNMTSNYTKYSSVDMKYSNENDLLNLNEELNNKEIYKFTELSKKKYMDDNTNKFDKELLTLESISNEEVSNNFIINNTDINNKVTFKPNLNPTKVVTNVRQEFISEDIIKTVKHLKTNGLEEITVKIKPKELGELSIHLIKDLDQTRVKIIISKEEVYNLINKNLSEIVNHLEDSNISVKEISVDIKNNSDNNFSDNLNSEFDRKNKDNQQGKKGKRIVIKQVENEKQTLEDDNLNILV